MLSPIARKQGSRAANRNCVGALAKREARHDLKARLRNRFEPSQFCCGRAGAPRRIVHVLSLVKPVHDLVSISGAIRARIFAYLAARVRHGKSGHFGAVNLWFLGMRARLF
jgi:hypothetical protein